MNDKELNELRLHANEIIRLLHEAKASGQVEILLRWAAQSVKSLDPEAFQKFIKDHTTP